MTRLRHMGQLWGNPKQAAHLPPKHDPLAHCVPWVHTAPGARAATQAPFWYVNPQVHRATVRPEYPKAPLGFNPSVRVSPSEAMVLA